MNPAMINSTNSVSTARRKREAERSVNWTVEETRVLLCAWSDERIQKSLAENLRNRHVFKQLSARMSEMGFFRNPQQCRLRVKTLKANYVRAKLQRSVDSSQPCTFKYFTEMDAVLSRRAVTGNGGPYTASPDRTPCLNIDATGHGFASLERRGPSLSSLEEGERHYSWQLDSDIKLEGVEHSADVFEFSNTGFPHQQRGPCPEEDQESSTNGEIAATQETSLSIPSPHGIAPPPASAPRDRSTASPLHGPPNPPTLPTTAHCHTDSSCLEPIVRHISDCFQRMMSDTRGLFVQLENQRQDQARWHQELLAQWLQREECRQREMAEREERREKARMEHEIRVLELLTSLTREQRCRCGGHPAVAEAQFSSNHTRKNYFSSGGTNK
ncbi:uncharacterized protein LOC130525536 [Takifugu flavidus]|uniref:Myb/SANT-like DNA-binding domain-containing protein n=1 Tax=Takifugu bimaculatus TaxID=433685 RepID=A0A4Z2BDS7_9TELE|nr:uncharacterized protein LOC130525536 [Takifugu flavidus]TNM90109.1 hypothetical protein fugu_004343 [Takifugu bimaculatus]